jgi:ribosomal protein S16
VDGHFGELSAFLSRLDDFNQPFAGGAVRRYGQFVPVIGITEATDQVGVKQVNFAIARMAGLRPSEAVKRFLRQATLIQTAGLWIFS